MPASALVNIGFSPEDAARVVPYRAVGCDSCRQTGYRGRVGLFEVMRITDAMRELILVGAPPHELRKLALNEGMSSLRQSGLRKIAAGVTTVEDVVRETVH